MFLHLGGDVIINKDEIIVILDLETATNAQTTRDFLKNIKEEGTIIPICESGKERSFVLTRKSLYLSPISSYTLMKRSNNNVLNFESE